MYPALGRGLVVLTNGVSGGLLNQITRAWDAEYGLATLPRRAERRVVPVAAATLERHAGRYALGGDTVVTVVRADDHLRVRVGAEEAAPAYAESDTLYTAHDGSARLEFERDAAGATTALVLRQGQASRRAPRATP
jgi:hypothetical protein